MSLDDFIRGLLNIPNASHPSPRHPRDSDGGDDGGGSGGGARENEPPPFSFDGGRDGPRSGKGAGVDDFYDFDRFIERQMRSVFAPFFGSRDSFWSGAPSPAITDDPGKESFLKMRECVVQHVWCFHEICKTTL